MTSSQLPPITLRPSRRAAAALLSLAAAAATAVGTAGSAEAASPAVTTVPTAPQAVQITARTTSTVTVTWQRPTWNGNSKVTGYRIWRTGQSSQLVAAWTRSYTVTGLTPATAYTVGVYAINAIGSSPTVTVPVITAGAPTVPTAPQSVGITGKTASTVTVSWGAAASDGGSPITGYRIWRTGEASHLVTSSTRSYTLTGLTSSTGYTLGVYAVNAVGNSPTATVPVTTDGVTGSITPQTTPAPVSTSHYLRNLTGDPTHDLPLLRQMGATDAGYNPSGHRYLVLQDIGAQTSGGVLLSATVKYISYSALVSALTAYADGYASTQKASAPMLLALGTNNDGSVSYTAGQQWADDVVDPVRAYVSAHYPNITVAGANDIEPGFSAGVTASRSWLSGYLAATSAQFVFNGSADGCPTGTSGAQCNNGWTTSDLHWLSGGAAPTQIVSLPQIYNTAMPYQWRNISAAGSQKVNFGGPLTEWSACSQGGGCTSATNVTAWTMLFNALASNSFTRVSAMPYGTDLRIN